MTDRKDRPYRISRRPSRYLISDLKRRRCLRIRIRFSHYSPALFQRLLLECWIDEADIAIFKSQSRTGSRMQSTIPCWKVYCQLLRRQRLDVEDNDGMRRSISYSSFFHGCFLVEIYLSHHKWDENQSVKGRSLLHLDRELQTDFLSAIRHHWPWRPH